MTSPPVGLIGRSSGQTTSCPGVSRACSASSANVRPGDGHGFTVDEPRLDQAARDDRRTAGPSEVDGGVPAAGLHVSPQRRAASDGIEVVDGERHARLPGDGEQVQNGVGRAAGRVHAGDRVLERAACHDLTRQHAAAQEVHREPPRVLADAILRRVGRGDAGRAHRRQAEKLERHRHGVGGELTATRARTGAGAVLQFLQVSVRELAGGVRAHRFEEIQHGDGLAAEVARLNRATI